MAAGADRFETRHRRKDGEEIQVEISVSRLAGGSERVFGFVRDITERKRAEATLHEAHDELERRVQNRTAELRTANAALRESEGKYRRLHESMTDAYASVDMAGRITEFNPAYQALLGYTAEELRQKTYVDLTPQKWHAFEARVVAEQVLPRGYSEVYEKEYCRKDGTIFPVELRTFLIRDANGQPAAMWAIVRDITERKLAEQALREVHDQLERRVQERTAELQAANAALGRERGALPFAGEQFERGRLSQHPGTPRALPPGQPGPGPHARLRFGGGIPESQGGRPLPGPRRTGGVCG